MGILTNQQLETMLGREVQAIHVLISKNMLMGSDASALAEMLGVERREIEDQLASDEYKEVHTLIAADENSKRLESIFTLDDIERTAWNKVGQRLEVEKDIETLARIATMANRATRRTSPMADKPLDPSQANERVKITLTKRVVESLQQGHIAAQTEDRLLIQGRTLNPTFKQVEELFSPREAQTIEHVGPQRETEVSFEAIMEKLNGRS